MFTKKNKRGVTLMELLVVMAVIAVIAVSTIPFMAATYSNRELDVYSVQAVDALSEAQFSALSGKPPRRFGVHFETNKFVVFRGSNYSAVDANNDVYALPQDVTVSAIALSGGAADVLFSGSRGLPSSTGTVTFSDQSGKTKVVTINAAGMVSSN